MDEVEKAIDLIRQGIDILERQWASEPRLHRLVEHKWEKGSGTLEGIDMAVVARHEESGSLATLMKIPAHPHDQRPHYHTGATHSLVLGGSVTVGMADRIVTLEPGDYFYSPASWIHTGSGSPGGVLLFSVNPADFDTVFVDTAQDASAKS